MFDPLSACDHVTQVSDLKENTPVTEIVSMFLDNGVMLHLQRLLQSTFQGPHMQFIAYNDPKYEHYFLNVSTNDLLFNMHHALQISDHMHISKNICSIHMPFYGETMELNTRSRYSFILYSVVTVLPVYLTH